MMDGYAVRSADREPRAANPGRDRRRRRAAVSPLTPGTASRIMTGAPLPEGADAVVPVEQTELDR